MRLASDDYFGRWKRDAWAGTIPRLKVIIFSQFFGRTVELNWRRSKRDFREEAECSLLSSQGEPDELWRRVSSQIWHLLDDFFLFSIFKLRVTDLPETVLQLIFRSLFLHPIVCPSSFSIMDFFTSPRNHLRVPPPVLCTFLPLSLHHILSRSSGENNRKLFSYLFLEAVAVVV